MHSRIGLRAVAFFDGGQGVLVLLAGFGLLSLIHQDFQKVAEGIVRHFQLDPASHYPRIFLQVAENLTDTKLWLMAGFALTYAAVRLIEGYGLWYARRWAAWLAVVSCGLYVPIEIYQLLLGGSWITVSALVINVIIVGYMSFVLKHPHHGGRAIMI